MVKMRLPLHCPGACNGLIACLRLLDAWYYQQLAQATSDEPPEAKRNSRRQHAQQDLATSRFEQRSAGGQGNADSHHEQAQDAQEQADQHDDQATSEGEGEYGDNCSHREE